MKFKRNILITGGAGFIGSHVVRLFVNQYPEYHIINLDTINLCRKFSQSKRHRKTQPIIRLLKLTSVILINNGYL